MRELCEIEHCLLVNVIVIHFTNYTIGIGKLSIHKTYLHIAKENDGLLMMLFFLAENIVKGWKLKYCWYSLFSDFSLMNQPISHNISHLE